MSNIKILSDEPNKVDNIFHLSDIHIRLYQRQEEYKEVFEKTYSILSKLPKENNIIVITGDILHSKIELSPECETMTIDFFTKLAEIYPTLFIAGNHDALLTNRHRLDSLSSIFYKRNIPNLYYLKNTGIYQYGNIMFHVDSLLDDITIDMKNGIDNKINIALFHGSIPGWKNIKGYTSDHGEKYIEDFTGMDYVLLGDIHMHQYMSTKKPISAYAGSLISQNFGETDENHGFMIWNLREKKQEYVKIKNRFRYQDLYLLTNQKYRTDNKVYSFEKLPIESNAHVKVFALEDEVESRIIFDNLKTKWKNATFYYQCKNNNTKQTDSFHNDTGEKTEEENIRNYVKQNTPSEHYDEIYESIMKNYELFKSYHTKLQWKLLRMQFSNMFGYGPDNEISFTKNISNQIIGIFGQNSAGKSTIIDVITTLLFDKNTRFNHGQSIPKEVIHFGEKEASGMIEIMIGGDIYRIQKKYKRGEKIKQTTKFYIIRDNKQEELTQEQRKKTNKFIQDMIGSFDKFIYTHCFLQQRENSFREMLPSSKKKFLNDLYGFHWFEKMEKSVKENIKELETHYKISSEQMSRKSNLTMLSMKEDLQKQMQENNLKINEKKDELKKLTTDNFYQQLQLGSKYSSFQDDYANLESKIQSHYDTNLNYNTEKTKLESFIQKWKNNPILADFVEHSDCDLFHEWCPSNSSLKEWKSFYESICLNSNEDVDALQNRLKILYQNVSSEELSIDKENLLLFQLSDIPKIKKQVENFNEKDVNHSLKQYYNELSHSFSVLEDGTLWNKKHKENKKKMNEKEALITTYQDKLNSFEKYNQFLKEENVKIFLQNETQWKDRELYKKFSPFVSNNKDSWIQYQSSIETSSKTVSELRKKSAQVEENLNNLQNNCPSYSKDDLISKKDFHVLQEKIKKLPYSCGCCEFIIDENFQESFMNLKELELDIFNLKNDIELLENNLKDCHFEPNPDCNVCLKNPEYENKMVWEKKLSIKKKDLKKKNTKREKIFESLHKKMKSVKDVHAQTYFRQKPSVDNLSSFMKEKTICHDRSRREAIEYQENCRSVKNYENFINYTDTLKQKSTYLAQKEDLQKKLDHVYFCIENKNLFEYITKQWNWFPVLPDSMDKLKEMFELAEDNNVLKEKILVLKNEVFMEKKEWVEFDKKWKMDLKTFKTIIKLEESLKKHQNYLIFLEEVSKTEKNDLNNHYKEEIELLEKKIENYYQWKENRKTLEFLQKIWKDESMWDVSSSDITKELEKAEKSLVQIEIDKGVLNDTIKHLEKEKIELKEKWNHDEKIYRQIEKCKKKKEMIDNEISKLEEERIQCKMKEMELKVEMENWEQTKQELYTLEQKLKKEQILLRLIDKDGLPLFLLKQKMKQMELNMNQLVKHFLPDKQIHFVLDDKNIEFGTTSKCDSKILCNYFGGMESFIIDLALKLTFTKFGTLPSSNFFIIDEGISVLDQQRQHNITFLFDFLSTITNNVLLISHIPQIRDFVNKSIHIQKHDGKSFVKFFLEK